MVRCFLLISQIEIGVTKPKSGLESTLRNYLDFLPKQRHFAGNQAAGGSLRGNRPFRGLPKETDHVNRCAIGSPAIHLASQPHKV
jgi:hypothetical protein